MIGAIVGDIVGSIYEWHNHRSKDFSLFGKGCFATDDSIMTIAVAKALLDCKGNYDDLSAKAIKAMQEVGRPYPRCGFGGSFYNWIYTDDPKPYNSYGNGAAMRVSACGFVAKDIEEAKKLAYKVTAVSHNHPEGIKGAESVAVAILLARQDWSKEDIKEYICQKYYDIDFTLDDIRDTYEFNETCQNTVPQAFEAFFESNSFEDAIRNAISVGGDSDTLAAITGGIAEAYYGVPHAIRAKAEKYLDQRLKPILDGFEMTYGRVDEYGSLVACLHNENGINRYELEQSMMKYADYQYAETLKKNGLDTSFLAKSEEIDVSNASTKLLLAMLTTIFRAEHFGSIGECQEQIDKGCVARWLRKIDENRKK